MPKGSKANLSKDIAVKMEDNVEEDTEVSRKSHLPESPKHLVVNVKKVNLDQEKSQRDEYLKKFDVFEDRKCLNLPNINLPEKIILVIDRAQDIDYTPFTADNNLYTPFSMLKRIVHKFIMLKSSINQKHEFAIAVLNENNAEWKIDFTKNQSRLFNILNRIDTCEVEDTLELKSLFENILQKVQLPTSINSHESPPEFVTRTILFYGRSYTIPKLEDDNAIRELLDNPYFICDVLMTHEPLDKNNHSEKIFNALQGLDTKGYAYFFPVARDAIRMHLSMGKLLAHPLQRCVQKLEKENCES